MVSIHMFSSTRNTVELSKVSFFYQYRQKSNMAVKICENKDFSFCGWGLGWGEGSCFVGGVMNIRTWLQGHNLQYNGTDMCSGL